MRQSLPADSQDGQGGHLVGRAPQQVPGGQGGGGGCPTLCDAFPLLKYNLEIFGKLPTFGN